eukprot:197930-Prorocentrum_minimum.AAC.2
MLSYKRFLFSERSVGWYHQVGVALGAAFGMAVSNSGRRGPLQPNRAKLAKRPTSREATPPRPSVPRLIQTASVRQSPKQPPPPRPGPGIFS